MKVHVLHLLTRYILGKIWPPALLAAGVVSFVVVGGAVRSQMREIADKIPISQMAVGDIAQIGLYALPTMVGYIFPITFLLGIMFVFGRLAQHSELIAMKAAGIPLKRIVMPVVFLGMALSVAAFWVADQVQPWAYRRLIQLVTFELPLRMTVDALPTGVMHEVGDWRVYLGDREADGSLRDIVILQPKQEGANAFYADRARLVKRDGKTQLILNEGYYIPADPRQHFSFETMETSAPLPRAGKMAGAGEGFTLAQLRAEEARLAQVFQETSSLPAGVELRNIRLKIKNRLAFPLMCLAVSIVGAPLGARSKRTGHSYAFTLGLGLIGLYFVLRKLVELSLLLPLPLTIALGQIPNLLLCILGLILIWRVDRV
ncbi:MAG: LptF/LptG family permease [Candidatus Hydrogenedentales bacterium]|jgi:lipopolysaccharide export system permease protein